MNRDVDVDTDTNIGNTRKNVTKVTYVYAHNSSFGIMLRKKLVAIIEFLHHF
jgi:hypothetical protein